MVNFMDFYYTDPGTLAGQYMRKFWHPIYRAEDLKPGWAKPIKIMGEQFTLYRGDDGSAARRRLSLPAPPNATFGGLGRGRLYSLQISRLEIR